jgi:hypothetical protein
MSRFSNKGKALIALTTCVAASALAVLPGITNVSLVDPQVNCDFDNSRLELTVPTDGKSDYGAYVEFTITTNDPTKRLAENDHPLTQLNTDLWLPSTGDGDDMPYAEVMDDFDESTSDYVGVIRIYPNVEDGGAADGTDEPQISGVDLISNANGGEFDVIHD